MIMAIVVYQKPTCTTCRQVSRLSGWLRDARSGASMGAAWPRYNLFMRVQARGLGLGLVFGSFVYIAAAVAAAGQETAANKGEQVMSGSCLNCHDIRPIQ